MLLKCDLKAVGPLWQNPGMVSGKAPSQSAVNNDNKTANTLKQSTLHEYVIFENTAKAQLSFFQQKKILKNIFKTINNNQKN